jgi:hypothetical protein
VAFGKNGPLAAEGTRLTADRFAGWRYIARTGTEQLLQTLF